MAAGLTSVWECARLRTTMIEAAWPWLRYQPGSALSRWFQEPLKRSDHFDARAAKRRPCGRAIFQNDSPPIVAPPELPPSQICHPAEKRRTMSRRSIPPHRCAASNLQLTSDRAFPHQLLGVSLPPPRRGQPRPILATQGRVTAVSVTRALPSSPFEFQLPYRGRSFTRKRLRVGLCP